MSERFADLLNGVVLAELGGYGNGPYCAAHGRGAALVMLGTYIVDPGDAVPYPPQFVFKPGRMRYSSYLREHVPAARASGGKVGVSVISVELSDSVDFLRAAEEAGADYASLCAHSIMKMFTDKGLGEALCSPAQRSRLRQWAATLAGAVTIPIIFKIGLDHIQETSAAIETIAGSGVPIVHIDIGECDTGSVGLQALRAFKGKCEFLVAGGGVKDTEGARRILDAGADAVAIGSAAMKDPAFCGRTQRALRPG
jgi:tRNA-dihydrouridine synthase